MSAPLFLSLRRERRAQRQERRAQHSEDAGCGGRRDDSASTGLRPHPSPAAHGLSSIVHLQVVHGYTFRAHTSARPTTGAADGRPERQSTRRIGLSPARRTPKRKIIHREKNIVYFPTGRKVVPLQCVQAQRCRHRKWLFYDRPDNGKQRLYFCNEPKQPIERSHISIL